MYLIMIAMIKTTSLRRLFYNGDDTLHNYGDDGNCDDLDDNLDDDLDDGEDGGEVEECAVYNWG